MFMDLKLNEEADKKRIKPERAAAAVKKRRGSNRTAELDEDELNGLLGSGDKTDD